MIAKINPRGHSFRGVAVYLLHDKGAQTAERIDWTATHNLPTDDIALASRVMAWTDQNRERLRENAAGAKARAGNVYHYSLSWSEEESIDREAMEAAALETIDSLKLSGHEFYLVGHNDTAHPHVHVVVNLVDPESGRIAKVYRDRQKLDRWANAYELEHGVVCKRRAKKYEELNKDRSAQVYPKKSPARRAELEQIVTEAFHLSDTGKALRSALMGEGLTLAQGNRRGAVVVDRDGIVYALNKLVDLADGSKGRARTKTINERIKDLGRDTLPMADEVAAERSGPEQEAPAPAPGPMPASRRKREAMAAARAIEAEAEQTKKAAADERKAALSERQRQWRTLQQRVAQKTRESRLRWGIDATAKRLVEARESQDQLTGFWARVFKRRQIAEAKERVQGLEQELKRGTDGFMRDVERFSAERPAWMQRRELEREGLVAAPAPAVALQEVAAVRTPDLEVSVELEVIAEREAEVEDAPAVLVELEPEPEQVSPERQRILEAARRLLQEREEALERDRDQGMGR